MRYGFLFTALLATTLSGRQWQAPTNELNAAYSDLQDTEEVLIYTEAQFLTLAFFLGIFTGSDDHN